MYLQNQQQAQRYQKLLVRLFTEQKVQQAQQEQVSGVHTVQMKLVQHPPQIPGDTLRAAGKGRKGEGELPAGGGWLWSIGASS